MQQLNDEEFGLFLDKQSEHMFCLLTTPACGHCRALIDKIDNDGNEFLVVFYMFKPGMSAINTKLAETVKMLSVPNLLAVRVDLQRLYEYNNSDIDLVHREWMGKIRNE